MTDSIKSVEPHVKETFEHLWNNETIENAITFIQSDHERTVKEQIELTEIPAPPFKEHERAVNYMERLKELNLEDVTMDDEGNVYGVRRGAGEGPTIFVSAHLDTVFPEGTDTTVREEDGVLYAPGIGDDTRGLAELLSIVRAFNTASIPNTGDIIFGATVGEEGAGDLRGVKAFFNEHKAIDAFISLDGPRPSHIVYLGTGSYRYHVTYHAPGGHSFGAFGLPSATHALGRAMANISDLETPAAPKTTFTVGEVWGGTSVNAIAAEASMSVDLRSNDEAELAKLEERFLAVVKKAAQVENARWNSDQVTVDIEKMGNRPSASQPVDAHIVQAAWCSIEACGEEPQLAEASSTDANYPMSLGVPSITLGRGGRGGNAHSLTEWHDPENGYIGVQTSLLTIVGLVGLEGVVKPLI